MIPCFQRSYCWSVKEAAEWWNTACYGKSESGASAGKIVLAPSASADASQIASLPSTVVDGQQRLVSTSLLVACIRDAVQKNHADDNGFASSLDALLFFDGTTTPRIQVASKDVSEYTALLVGKIPSLRKQSMSLVKGLFDERLRSERMLSLGSLMTLAASLVDHLPIVSVTLADPSLSCQVYLWLQEKALFSEAASATKKTLGVYFSAGDLIRNLLLAPFLDVPLEEQSKIYSDLWSSWESRMTAEQLDAFLAHWVHAELQRSQAIPTDVEKKYDTCVRRLGNNFLLSSFTLNSSPSYPAACQPHQLARLDRRRH